jgi:UDP-2,3-diacylglucosamine hydrolase
MENQRLSDGNPLLFLWNGIKLNGFQFTGLHSNTGFMIKAVYFISDVHLGFADKAVEWERESRLVRFLERVAQNGSALFIVGDLFDFWYEYSAVIPRRYFSILRQLRNLSDRGVRVVYLAGNHDFGIGSFIRDDLKAEISLDPLDETLNGKRFYIDHGDGIAKSDVGYRLLKKILRHPWNQALFRAIHPDFGFAAARFFSRLSRNHRESRDQDDEYIGYARERFKEGFDCVVMAHTHRAQFFQDAGRTYINTGDWMEGFTYGKFEAGKLSLEKWDVSE